MFGASAATAPVALRPTVYQWMAGDRRAQTVDCPFVDADLQTLF